MSKETSFIVQTERGYSFGISIEQEHRIEGVSIKYPDKRIVKCHLAGHEETFEKASERLAWAGGSARWMIKSYFCLRILIMNYERS